MGQEATAWLSTTNVRLRDDRVQQDMKGETTTPRRGSPFAFHNDLQSATPIMLPSEALAYRRTSYRSSTMPFA